MRGRRIRSLPAGPLPAGALSGACRATRW